MENLLRMADMFDRMKTTVTTHDERIGEYQAIISEVSKHVNTNLDHFENLHKHATYSFVISIILILHDLLTIILLFLTKGPTI